MKKIHAVLLQSAAALFGAAVLSFMLWLPPHEGRNVNATLFAVYFKDPFLAYLYIGSVPFFTALYQVFRLLGRAGRGELFTAQNLKALRIIRLCALATAGIVAGAVIFVRVGAAASGDDPAGFVIPGLLAVFSAAAAAAGAAVIESAIRRGRE